MRSKSVLVRASMCLLLGGAVMVGCGDDDDADTTTTTASTPGDTADTTRDNASAGSGTSETVDAGIVVPTVRLTDPQIVGLAEVTHMSEVQAGELALQKSTNPATRDFASSMVAIHTQALQRQAELGIAPAPSSERVALESQTAQTQQTLLDAPPGNAFDAAYLQAQVASHMLARDQIDRIMLPSAVDPALRSELMNVRAEVVMHLDQVTDLYDLVREGPLPPEQRDARTTTASP